MIESHSPDCSENPTASDGQGDGARNCNGKQVPGSKDSTSYLFKIRGLKKLLTSDFQLLTKIFVTKKFYYLCTLNI